MPFKLPLTALLSCSLLAGCNCSPRPQEQVVARWEGVAVRADDVRHAAKQRHLGAKALADAEQLEAVARAVLVDAALAREGRGRPGGAARARAAARAAALQLLLESEVRGQGPAQAPGDYHRAHEEDFTEPAQLRVAQLTTAGCERAQAIKLEIEARKITFEAAALRDSTDQETKLRGGDLGWKREEELAPAVRRVVRELREGEVGGPVVTQPGACLLVHFMARREARTQPLHEVQVPVERRIAAGAAGRARRALVAKLGGTKSVQLDAQVLEKALQDGTLAGELAVATLGEERITVGELRARQGGRANGRVAAFGGAKGLGTRVAEDLLLWREAQRRGLDRRAEVRAAVRWVLLEGLRQALEAEVTPASVSAEAVREVYQKNEGDYTEPRRVQVSALVTGDQKKAEGWVKTLRAAKFPTDAFEKLLPESEDATARAKQGDQGWIDGRSMHVAETLKQAALLLETPGAVSGVLPSASAYHVLLCRDTKPPRVKPLAEVEGEIRGTLAQRARRTRYEQKVAEVRAKVRPVIDHAALARVARGAK